MAMMAYTFEHQAALDRELQLLAAQRGAWQAGRELLH